MKQQKWLTGKGFVSARSLSEESEKLNSSAALNSGRLRKKKSTGGINVHLVLVIVHIGELYQN